MYLINKTTQFSHLFFFSQLLFFRTIQKHFLESKIDHFQMAILISIHG